MYKIIDLSYQLSLKNVWLFNYSSKGGCSICIWPEINSVFMMN